MADTPFVSKVTHILATWLNDINKTVYRALGTGGVAPVTPAEVRDNLGLTGTGGAALIGQAVGGGSLGGTVQAAMDLKAPKASPYFTGYVNSAGEILANNTPTSIQTAGGMIVEGLLWSVGNPAVFGLPPTGFTPKAGHFSHAAPSGADASDIVGALLVQTFVDSGNTSKGQWAQLTRLENYAAVGENVGITSQSFKRGAGSTWAGVFEAHDTTHVQPTGSLYGLEIDISANGSDISPGGFSQRFGIQLVGYRDDPAVATCTASFGPASTTMHVVSVESGTVAVGQAVYARNVPAGTVITALGTGTGGAGTYIVNNTLTVPTAPVALGGGAVNHIGHGIWIGSRYDDPVGSVFTNAITLACDSDLGIVMIGHTAVGLAFRGYYDVAPIQSINTSAVPIISSVGSAHSALYQFASTDAVNGPATHITSGSGVWGCFKVVVDGADYWVPYYKA
jgi:hypothetical protein